MTDEQIRAAHARIGPAADAELRERIFMKLCTQHDNTPRLLLEVDRIVRYIQTGETAAPSKASA